MSHQTLHKHHHKSKDNSTLYFAAILLPIIVFVIVFAILFMNGRTSQESRKAVNNSHINPSTKPQNDSEEITDDDSFTGDTVEYQGKVIEVPPPTL